MGMGGHGGSGGINARMMLEAREALRAAEAAGEDEDSSGGKGGASEKSPNWKPYECEVPGSGKPYSRSPPPGLSSRAI